MLDEAVGARIRGKSGFLRGKKIRRQGGGRNAHGFIIMQCTAQGRAGTEGEIELWNSSRANDRRLDWQNIFDASVNLQICCHPTRRVFLCLEGEWWDEEEVVCMEELLGWSDGNYECTRIKPQPARHATKAVQARSGQGQGWVPIRHDIPYSCPCPEYICTVLCQQIILVDASEAE
jgi:hypothetical protein